MLGSRAHQDRVVLLEIEDLFFIENSFTARGLDKRIVVDQLVEKDERLLDAVHRNRCEAEGRLRQADRDGRGERVLQRHAVAVIRDDRRGIICRGHDNVYGDVVAYVEIDAVVAGDIGGVEGGEGCMNVRTENIAWNESD